ncbi:MAG TPA: neutral zinc metallopeptidase [Terriglobales bacterium]|nr:neutral zinc metallopeptidase [Terriglobales bacterium]
MRWTPGGRSQNIEDRRTAGSAGIGLGGGGLRLGIGGVIVLAILSIVFKRDFFSLVGSSPGGIAPASATSSNPALDAREEPLVQFVSFVLDDAQNTWKQILPANGAQYRDAKLVLFRDAVNSACGFAQSATGPFYCPADQKVYIDLGFYNELKNRFGASGDFAQAYVLAHEIGHHVQNLLGIDAKVRQVQRANPGAANQLSVRLELQADCLAGVWGHSTARRNILEQGDLEKALNAAAAIGDDRLQRMGTGRVSPESFTHGSSQQRMQWFQTGFNSGTLSACNTFAQ